MRLWIFAAFAMASPAFWQTTLTPADAVHEAFVQRDALKAGLLRVEDARRTGASTSAYPATRVDLGHSLFNQVDIGGSPDLLLYQPLDIFNKTGSLRGQANAAIATALAAYRQTALDIQQETLTAYANLSSDQRLLELAVTQQSLAEATASLTAKRVAARDLPEIQSTRADLEVEKANQLVEDRKAAVSASRLRLAGAIGLDDLGSSDSLEALKAPDANGSDPTANRPELLTLRAEAESARADGDVASKVWLPDLELQAGRNSFDQPTEYGARLQLTFNLIDHGATNNLRRAASARLKAANAALADRIKAAKKEIDAANIEVAAAEKSLAAYQHLADGAKTLLDRTQRGFELGANILIDVIDARRALSDAQELAVNASLRRDLAIEALLRSQGILLEQPK